MYSNDQAGEHQLPEVFCGRECERPLCNTHERCHAHGREQCPIKDHLHTWYGHQLSKDGRKSKKKNDQVQFEIIYDGGLHLKDQRGTYLYMKSEITVKIELGNQAATTGGRDPVSAKVLVMVKNRMKIKASKKPSAI